MALFPAFATLVSTNEPDVANWFVVVMGIGIVFFGLVCIVGLCSAMSAIIRAIEKNKKPAAEAVKSAPAAAPAAPITNRQEFIAAVSVAIAEELGTDVSAIRILSVKPL